MKRLFTIGITSIALLLAPFVSLPATALSWDDIFGGASSPAQQVERGVQAVTNEAPDSEHSCARVENHEYEVCTAYIANSSSAVLVPYYKYAHAEDGWQRYVTYRLGSRYHGSAYDAMRQRTASWPSGINDVDAPRIHIVSVDSDLSSNTATLVTRESWRVTDQDGNVLYQESDQKHVVTMRRVQSYVLHKWVVTDIR